MNLHSQDLSQQKLDELRNIFPEIFEDGLINYDKFKTILGENIDEKSELYDFEPFDSDVKKEFINCAEMNVKFLQNFQRVLK